MSKSTWRHPAAIAWDEWIESEAGKSASEPYDFTRIGYRQYLENRLARAFNAGYNSAEKLFVPQERTSREQVVELAKAGLANTDIARQVGISRQRVSQLVNKYARSNRP